MSNKDYYKILGVSKSASADEIKKAFRTLAHKHHPDKQGGDEVKFKEINEAYQVLSDSQKRQQYDQFGSNFEQAGHGAGFGGFGGQGFNWQDFAQQGGVQFDMGDLGDMFGDFFGGSRGSKKKRGQDIQIDITLEFKESIFGVNKTVELYKNASCTTCSGSGGKPGSKKHTCEQCKGSGQVVTQTRTILGVIQQRSTCQSCQGQGATYEEKCGTCKGAGVTKQKETISIPIPAGVDHGAVLQMQGKGEAVSHGVPGDLYIKVRVKEDQKFERDGYNLYSRIEIPFATAVLGGKIEIDVVDGGTEIITIPAGTQSGSEFVLKQKGVSHPSGKRGEYIVTVHIAVPKHVSREQKKTLEDLGL